RAAPTPRDAAPRPCADRWVEVATGIVAHEGDSVLEHYGPQAAGASARRHQLPVRLLHESRGLAGIGITGSEPGNELRDDRPRPLPEARVGRAVGVVAHEGESTTATTAHAGRDQLPVGLLHQAVSPTAQPNDSPRPLPEAPVE